ncbi:TPR-like protein [Colletotrichum asianum]
MGVRVIEKGKIVLGLEVDDVTTEYLKRCQWKEAEELGLMVIETRIGMFGEEHPETLRGMHVLAFVYLNQKRNEVLGKENADTLDSMGNLAITYTHQG